MWGGRVCFSLPELVPGRWRRPENPGGVKMRPSWLVAMILVLVALLYYHTYLKYQKHVNKKQPLAPTGSCQDDHM